MDLPRKIRYRAYADWSKEERETINKNVKQSPWHASYHIEPKTGLLNDPNGFSFFNGKYTLFYQNWPFGAAHGLKEWVHTESDDLVHFYETGTELRPDTKRDSHGAYSGSAYEIDGKLFLFYTGNVRDENWVRYPFQIGAWMDKDYNITKCENVLIHQANDVTDHFRDPQLFNYKGQFYAILGAQNLNESGFIKLYKAVNNDIENWEEVGNLDFGGTGSEYMIECPNLVFVDDKPVLLYCPQGLDKTELDYSNIFPNTYKICQSFDTKHAKLVDASEIQNLDYGFEAYATQGFNAPDGRALIISWIGLPDISYPTDSENWANCLSQVKELSVVDGELYQRPVPAMASLREEGTLVRSEEVFDDQQIVHSAASKHYELKLDLAAGQNGKLFLAANKDLSQGIEINFSTADDAFLTVDRSKAGIPFAEDYGTTRTIALPANKQLSLDIFVDGSVCEIFVNNGRHTLTLRFFAPDGNNKIAFTSDKKLQYTGTYWNMKNI